MKLYNSLTRVKEDFLPLVPGQVGLYTCGPTVYDYQHIGNLRAYITWDVLKRLLTHHGLAVTHIMNITDVGHLTSDNDSGEDKLEVAKLRDRKSAWDVALDYTQIFKDDLAAVNVLSPTHFVPATETITEQIALALKLDAAGFLYRTSDGMYFDTSKLADYGKLAQINKVDLLAGARVEMNPEKKNVSDFAVWKFSPKKSQRDMEWNSPWGKGFPGWHLECSAISMLYLGETFDIHTGGIDHLTVHHPNEMAQSEAVTGKPLAKYWLHNAFLNFGEDKMSKSKGTFVTLDDLREKGIPPLAYRFFLLQTHYRKVVQFSWDALEAAKTGLINLGQQIVYFPDASGSCQEYDQQFLEAIDNDLATPQALAVMMEMLGSRLPSAQKMGSLEMMESILDLGLLEER
ncbi:MAG: cysteine--tRNA ligase [Candidatus Komeilibacteria bacterium]